MAENPKPTTQALTTHLWSKPVGRPPKFQDAKELEEETLKYFSFCKENGRLPTKHGYRIWLGADKMMMARMLIRPRIKEAVNLAYDLIEEAWVQELKRPSQVAGAIFYLKNAFHYEDMAKTQINTAFSIGALLREAHRRKE